MAVPLSLWQFFVELKLVLKSVHVAEKYGELWAL